MSKQQKNATWLWLSIISFVLALVCFFGKRSFAKSILSGETPRGYSAEIEQSIQTANIFLTFDVIGVVFLLLAIGLLVLYYVGPKKRTRDEALPGASENQGFLAQNSDLGYLIIALLILVRYMLWQVWEFAMDSKITGNETIYKAFVIFSSMLGWWQFAVMFLFTRKQVFKIIIAVIFAIWLATDIYEWIKMFQRF